MSREHVEKVFGPQWIQDALAYERQRARLGERITIRLRELLRERDPDLPDPFDGTKWAEIEALDQK